MNVYHPIRTVVKLYRTIRIAMKALRRNPMRALLTTLGIVIGVSAVIAMMEIGAGSSAAVQKSISSMGANVVLVMPGTATSSGISFGMGRIMPRPPDDADAILRECPAVRTAAPAVRARVQVVYGNRNWVPSSMYGTTPAFLSVRDWTVVEGESFTDRDVLNGNRVCLIGKPSSAAVRRRLAPGQELRVKNVTFRVVACWAARART
jgi:ABC-type antimicrobial peptide transport system permease subunit